MRLDHVSRELICKVVYCGPGMSGKTTNLQFIHERAPKHAVGDMVSIDTESERTLHFDLLPLDLGTVQGYKCRFEFYTVPGQTYYGATRRMVLENTDGIVFVADSRRDMLDENVDALNDLYENLQHHNLASDLPMVVQFNKQDLPDALSPDQLNPLLNPRAVEWFRGVATSGEGVLETMRAITTKVIDNMNDQHDLQTQAPDHSQAPAPSTPAPPPPTTTAAAPSSWIITCHNCQSLLEVPRAEPGDIYSCGSCGAPLEVVNGEHGLTRPPVSNTGGSLQSGAHTGPLPPSPPPPQQPPLRQMQQPPMPAVGEETGYGMQAIPEHNPLRSSALSAGPDASPSGAHNTVGPTGTGALPNQAFILDGFQSVARLDESLLGQRYRIRDTSRGRYMRALVLSQAVTRQPGFRPSLEPSLTTAGNIHHEHLLHLSGMRANLDDVVVLYADAPDHEPLSHVLARRQVLQTPQALAVIRQVTEALNVAAQKGAIHGWIRPDVILLNPEGKVLLDELGIPKPHAYLLRESMGASAATEHYLAPEHLLNDSPSDLRTDLFMLGAVLFRILSGEGLVTGYSSHEALHKVSASGCRSVRSVNPEVPREVDALVTRMTAIDRKDRFQSYREVLTALDSLMLRRGATMKLTRSIPATGTGPISRRPAGQGTAATRRRAGGTGPISKGHHRRTRSTGSTGPIHETGQQHQGTQRRTQKNSGNTAIVLILLILVIGVIGVAVLVNQQQGGSVPPPRSTDTATPTTPNPQSGTSTTPDPVAPPQQPVTTTTQPGATPQAPGNDSNQALLAAARAAVADYQANADDRQKLATAQAALEKIQAIDRRTWNNLRQVVTTAMPIDIGQPVTTQDPASGGTPTPEQPQPAGADLTDTQRAELETLIAAEQFGTALSKLDDWGVAARVRGGWESDIADRHSQARSTLQREIMASGDAVAAQALLDPAITTWAMDGDQAWAEALIAAVATTTPEPGTSIDTPIVAQDDSTQQEAELSPNGYPLNLLRTDRAINDALAASLMEDTERLLKQLPADDPLTAAITHKVQLWNRRSTILDESIAAGRPRTSVTPPIGTAKWDVTGASDRGLQVSRPAGGGMILEWNQVNRGELGSLFGSVASSPNARPVEIALASVANMLSSDPGPAVLFFNRASKENYEGSQHLQVLVELFREQAIITLLDEADKAAASNDPARLADVITELSRGDRLNSPTVATRVEELQELRQALLTGEIANTGNVTGEQAKDMLTFDDPTDRDAFSERTGIWLVTGGHISNDGDGRLARTDAGNVNALSVSFESAKNSGATTINFRGVRLIADFSNQSIIITSNAGQRGQPEDFPLLPNVANQVYMTYLQSGMVSVELNQRPPTEVMPGNLNTEVSIQVDTGGQIRIDEVELKRGVAGPQAGRPDNNENQDILRQALGIEPLGGAYKDPESTRIIMPPLAQGKSGIGLNIRDGIRGYSMIANGTGTLAVGMGIIDRGTGLGDTYEFDLPPAGSAPKTITITWTQNHFQVVIEQENFVPVSVELQRPDDATHVIVIANQTATLATTPKIVR